MTVCLPLDALVVEDLDQQRLPARTVAAVLGRAGFRARLAHLGASGDADGIAALVQAEQPRLVVLSIDFDHLLSECLALAARLRAAGSHAHITLSGPLPALNSATLLGACAALNSVVCGEAEATVAELLQRLIAGRGLGGTPGLARRLDGGRPAPIEPPPAIALDELPCPDRSDGIATTAAGYGYATIEASRGCYHRCSFCLPSAFYHTQAPPPAHRVRGVAHLLNEVEALRQRGVRLLLFDDEQFLPPPATRAQRIEELGEQLARRGLHIAFTIKCRPDDVETDLFGHLRELGLVRVFLGLESGHKATLVRYGKGTSPDQGRKALETLAELGIVADFRMLAFHPWATRECLAGELDFLAAALPALRTPFSLFDVILYPGTALAGRLELERAAELSTWGRPGQEAATPVAYRIADPRAELLRRLNHLVFGARGEQSGLISQISAAWYDALLDARFRPSPTAQATLAQLAAIVLALNTASLALWRDMLDWVSAADLRDSARVNAVAGMWCAQARECELEVNGRLELLRQHQRPPVGAAGGA